ncbi:MAG: hypothetical protein MZV63_15690 [Marinilabiliales bacterium]|nr:hypothetical protein [Marinilabiliales bacterium]
MMTINSNMVEIAYMSFHDQGAGISLQLGNTAATWRAYIHDCYFGGNDTAQVRHRHGQHQRCPVYGC